MVLPVFNKQEAVLSAVKQEVVLPVCKAQLDITCRYVLVLRQAIY